MTGEWVIRVGSLFASWTAGDAGAVEDLWRLVRPRMVAILRRKFRLSRGEAAEAAEEAFGALYLHRNAVRSADRAWAYLRVIAERKALALIDRRRSQPLPFEEIPAGHGQDSDSPGSKPRRGSIPLSIRCLSNFAAWLFSSAARPPEMRSVAFSEFQSARCEDGSGSSRGSQGTWSRVP